MCFVLSICSPGGGSNKKLGKDKACPPDSLIANYVVCSLMQSCFQPHLKINIIYLLFRLLLNCFGGALQGELPLPFGIGSPAESLDAFYCLLLSSLKPMTVLQNNIKMLELLSSGISPNWPKGEVCLQAAVVTTI